MSEQRFDVVVLGAGIVGVSTALHLIARGRSVCLIDRGEPGLGTSYGNAGLIERASVIPYSFPQGLGNLLRYALNNRSDVRYDPFYVPRIAGWLYRFWRESNPDRLKVAIAAMLPLIEACVREHDYLIVEAGCRNLIRANGWIEVHRSTESFHAAVKRLPSLQQYRLSYDVLDSAALHAREPGLGEAAGAIHWLDPKTVINPGGLVKAYADLFVTKGGVFLYGDAGSTVQRDGNWQVTTDKGLVTAKDIVVALGPQAGIVFRKFGYGFPLAVKRGHHIHFTMKGGAQLGHSIVDDEAGYVLAPMVQGVRLTTGIEFASPDAPPNRIQIRRTEKIARKLLPQLGDQIEATPWLGLRPCLPDMRPIIGAAPNHKGLWFNFGHAHHGLTLGPASGRLLAEMMSGERPYIDPTPYSAHRFL